MAHSLGCRHTIEAISALSASQRPDAVHLCAPACLEDAVAEHLGSLARSHTTLYFTPNDLVLRTGFALMAGGGMRTGQVIGATDRHAGAPVERPVKFQEVFATLYHCLGVDPTTTTVDDHHGRPHYLVEAGSRPMRELVG